MKIPKYYVLFIILALLLTACGSPPADEVAPTAVPAPETAVDRIYGILGLTSEYKPLIITNTYGWYNGPDDEYLSVEPVENGVVVTVLQVNVTLPLDIPDGHETYMPIMFTDGTEVLLSGILFFKNVDGVIYIEDQISVLTDAQIEILVPILEQDDMQLDDA